MTLSVDNFSDRVLEQIDNKRSYAAVGLDPDYSKIPRIFAEPAFKSCGNTFTALAETIISFNRFIIDTVAPYVPIVKPQIAFYEMYGLEGVRAFVETVRYAKEKGLIVIEDAKRNDIGSTAKAYSVGHLGKAKLADGAEEVVFDVNAITVNPYLGSDGIIPFLDPVKQSGKGIFVLVKTSNPSSGEIQDLILRDGTSLFEHVGNLVNQWGLGALGQRGYSSVGAVVGATYPEHAATLRTIMPSALFLVPGYGAQGATGQDVIPCFNEDGYGAIISASRSINYPFGDNLEISEESFSNLVRAAVDNMNNDINEVLKSRGILPW